MPALELKNITKRFGRVVAVDKFNMRVETGEFVTLLGPSGCGKSTTLNMIAGLERVDDGEIFIGDQLANNLQPKDRDIAMVFQNYALYPHLTVQENLAFPLKARHTPRAEIVKIVENAASILGINDLMERLPKQLSGGQRQRVALGRAIVRHPRLFLMDEPLSNLDAKLRVHMRAELRHLHDELKTTTIYVTHDQAEAMTLSDRIAVLNYGVLQQLGTPSEVYEQPLNPFVAGFLGSYPMNFFDGTLHRGDNTYINNHDIHYKLIPEMAEYLNATTKGNEVIIGTRPEHTRVTLVEEENGIPGEIYAVEQMGSDSLVYMNVGSHRFIVRMEPNFPGRTGDSGWLVFNPAKLNVFDKTSQVALWWGRPASAQQSRIDSALS